MKTNIHDRQAEFQTLSRVHLNIVSFGWVALSIELVNKCQNKLASMQDLHKDQRVIQRDIQREKWGFWAY